MHINKKNDADGEYNSKKVIAEEKDVEDANDEAKSKTSKVRQDGDEETNNSTGDLKSDVD